MSKPKILNMKKKGQLEIAVLLVLGLVVVIGGTIYAGNTILESAKVTKEFNYRYIGDLNTELVYDTTKCVIQSNNLVGFNSLEQAYLLEFKDAPNCV